MSILFLLPYTAGKVSKYGIFSGPYFPAFGLNTERYFVPLRIQSECGKLRTRKNSIFGHISHSANANVKYKTKFFTRIPIRDEIFFIMNSIDGGKVWHPLASSGEVWHPLINNSRPNSCRHEVLHNYQPAEGSFKIMQTIKILS